MEISLFGNGKGSYEQYLKMTNKERLGECSNCNTEKVLIKHSLCRRCRLKEYDRLVENE